MKFDQIKYSEFSNKGNLSSPVFASRLSLYVCIFLSVTGVILGFTEHSLAVTTNGLIAGVDIINSLFFFSAVKQSIKTPDVFHTYGYGKYQALAILSGAVLLTIIGFISVFRALSELEIKEIHTNFTILIIFASVSFLLMQIMSRYQKKAAEKHSMPVLAYDSDIWKYDSYIEILIVINLITGMVISDKITSVSLVIIDICVTLFIFGLALRAPIKHSKQALNQLLDRSLPETIQFDILAVIVENIQKMCEYNGVHTRQAGKDIFIEIDVVMPFDFTLEQVFQTEKNISNMIREKYPAAIPRIYATPCSKDCVHNGEITCPVKKSMLS